MQLKPCWMILTIVLISIASQTGYSKDTDWRTIGLRGGISDNRNDEDFQQYEGFVTWYLPWARQWDSGWAIGTYLETNAGVLTGGGDSAFVGSIGPGIYISGLNEKFDLSLGINPTIISEHNFGDENLGGPIEFTSHIGLNFNLARHLTVGYRLQHMSNAGIYNNNPGLNIHMIEVGYRF